MDQIHTKRILVISDSLALPRNKPEVNLFEDTYPRLLQKDFIVLQLSYGGGTIREIIQQANYYTSFNPDYIVIQSGIVDCAYRAFPLFVDKGASYSKILNFYRRIVARVISPRFLRNHLRIRYTSPKLFKEAYEQVKVKFPNAKVIAIGIVPASEEYEALVRGIKDSIQQYNNIIKESSMVDYFIDMGKMDNNCIMSDYHHINKNGHLYIYNSIVAIINNLS